MTQNEFQAQMARLQSEWPKAFGPEKTKALWDHIKDLPAQWFEKFTTRTLIYGTGAPKLPEIIELANIEKKSRADLSFIPKDIQLAPGSIFSKDEVRELFRIVKAAATKEINLDQAKQYAKMTARLIAEKLHAKGECTKCGGTGELWAHKENSLPYIFKCDCKSGHARSEKWPTWSDYLTRQGFTLERQT